MSAEETAQAQVTTNNKSMERKRLARDIRQRETGTERRIKN
jgi:hypothetical protein